MVIFPESTGETHVYFVPDGIELVDVEGIILKVEPPQIWWVISAIIGFGLTFTIIVNVLPAQLPKSPDIGVTV